MGCTTATTCTIRHDTFNWGIVLLTFYTLQSQISVPSLRLIKTRATHWATITAAYAYVPLCAHFQAQHAFRSEFAIRCVISTCECCHWCATKLQWKHCQKTMASKHCQKTMASKHCQKTMASKHCQKTMASKNKQEFRRGSSHGAWSLQGSVVSRGGHGACGVLSEKFLFCNSLNSVISFSGTNYNLFA